MAPTDPFVLVPEPREPPGRWLRLLSCLRVLQSRDPADVPAVLAEVEAEAERGRIAAGFVAYDAAPAFDPALTVQTPADGLPVVWFAVFEHAESFDPDTLSSPDGHDTPWAPGLQRAAYDRAVAAIHAAIARGETYQVNLTFPLRAAFAGDPRALFARLNERQRGSCGAFIETADFAICSASPELFFARDGDRIVCRPMKGTAPRGRWTAEDDEHATALRDSIKNRAENLMIVDMVRNDLGRIAETGSVRAERLFEIERYPTVLQMTSTVEARTTAGLPDLFRALFPSASITGAPKVQTTRLIAALEPAPRGLYTGAIGVIGPGRAARFNVAIRTAVVDKRASTASYATGSGVVWDSSAAAEYEECLAKARALGTPRPAFDLLETLRWDRASGFALLEGHLQRLTGSARYFQRPCDPAAIRQALEQAAVTWTDGARRVRLVVDATGVPSITSAPLTGSACFEDRPRGTLPVLRAAFASVPADSDDLFLHHKTTHRALYAAARAEHPLADESLLTNRAGEVTEGTIGNLVLDLEGAWITPPRASGLLGGVFREHLLQRGVLAERPVRRDDLARARGLYLINSVRGWCRLLLAD